MEEIGKELALEVLGTLKTAKDFVVEQAPSVIQELVVYKQVQFGTLGAFSLLLTAITAFLVWKICRHHKTEDTFPHFMVSMITGAAGVACLTAFFARGLVWLVAPKVALLEYLAEVVK